MTELDVCLLNHTHRHCEEASPTRQSINKAHEHKFSINMEINFYQVDDIIYKSIAPLLIKVLDEDKKALIYCQDEKQVEEIDGGLWSFSKTKFIPHGTKNNPPATKLAPEKQPVFITDQLTNSNQAEYLIMLGEVEEKFLKEFGKIFYFFSSGNVADARKLWAKYKKQSFTLNFYKKDDSGWVKVDL